MVEATAQRKNAKAKRSSCWLALTTPLLLSGVVLALTAAKVSAVPVFRPHLPYQSELAPVREFRAPSPSAARMYTPQQDAFPPLHRVEQLQNEQLASRFNSDQLLLLQQQQQQQSELLRGMREVNRMAFTVSHEPPPPSQDRFRNFERSIDGEAPSRFAPNSRLDSQAPLSAQTGEPRVSHESSSHDAFNSNDKISNSNDDDSSSSNDNKDSVAHVTLESNSFAARLAVNSDRDEQFETARKPESFDDRNVDIDYRDQQFSDSQQPRHIQQQQQQQVLQQRGFAQDGNVKGEFMSRNLRAMRPLSDLSLLDEDEEQQLPQRLAKHLGDASPSSSDTHSARSADAADRAGEERLAEASQTYENGQHLRISRKLQAMSSRLSEPDARAYGYEPKKGQRVQLMTAAQRLAVGQGEVTDLDGVVHHVEADESTNEPSSGRLAPDHNTFTDRRGRNADGSVRQLRPDERLPLTQRLAVQSGTFGRTEGALHSADQTSGSLRATARKEPQYLGAF
eukprot:CAMPEP_0185833440 /NCGR_PEP_ID=MMETSP1353-20130828/2844_1 /TAXON_ID=1077150 /ORGANISM="Erythrolobus australicus, Strain CCMP3124" /LENGTH=508 /DNA_ID=CAMNT_0028531729 /DNA_START=184 /DNA_END=1710 /DNA_ORIENTATION=+